MPNEIRRLIPLFAMWLLARTVMSAEAAMPADQKLQPRTFDSGKSSWEDGTKTYTVQSGYEGYLVPVESQPLKDIFGGTSIIRKFISFVTFKAAIALVAGTFLGILAITGFCVYTSLCPYSYSPGWDRNSAPEDRLRTAEHLLASALDKFARVEKNSL